MAQNYLTINLHEITLDKQQTRLTNGQLWLSVDINRDVQYSSLIGLPSPGIPQQENASFEMKSRYWEVDCPSVTYLTNHTYNSTWLMSQGPNTLATSALSAPTGEDIAEFVSGTYSFNVFSPLWSRFRTCHRESCQWTR